MKLFVIHRFSDRKKVKTLFKKISQEIAAKFDLILLDSAECEEWKDHAIKAISQAEAIIVFDRDSCEKSENAVWEIKKAEEAGEDVAAVRTKLANEYTYNVASPFLAAERGELDGVIEPAATRVAVVKALRALRTKRATLPAKKHGNIPL